MKELIGPGIKAVIFDWDDTLVGTIEGKWAQHKHVAKTFYNRELTDEDLSRYWGKPLTKLVRLLYANDNIEEVMNHLISVDKDFPKVLFDHTLGVVERLRANGRLVALVTAHNSFGLNQDFDDLGIPLGMFDYIQTEDDTSFHKPDPRVFESTIDWLKRKSILPDEAMYIGDGLHDREAAVGASMQFIGVATGLVSVDQFENVGSLAVKSLEDLL